MESWKQGEQDTRAGGRERGRERETVDRMKVGQKERKRQDNRLNCIFNFEWQVRISKWFTRNQLTNILQRSASFREEHVSTLASADVSGETCGRADSLTVESLVQQVM